LSGRFLLLPRRFLAADMSLLSCYLAAFKLWPRRFLVADTPLLSCGHAVFAIGCLLVVGQRAKI